MSPSVSAHQTLVVSLNLFLFVETKYFFFLKKGTNFFLSPVPVVVNNVYANVSSGVSDNKEVDTVFDTGINMVCLL